ncbi:MAG: LysR family transcriptional regulator [Holosporales bacterium]|jgi:DNA-binding transcriptional LysR family regulator|nr:LysR family transcriptional regulator [Holosporales bacterium]
MFIFEGLRNFVKFAERGMAGINISQEHFLSQVGLIEKELRHRIVVRVSRSEIAMTEFGREFSSYAKRSIAAIDEGIATVDKRNIYDLDNQITLGLVRDSAATWAMNCIKDFNKRHPGLRLILLAENKLTDEMLEHSNIIFWSVAKIPDGYDVYWYIEFKYGLYASSDYIKEHGIPTLETIDKHTFIAYSGKDNNAEISNWHLYGRYGLPLIKPAVFSQSRDLIVKMTSEGAGIGAISDRQDVYYDYNKVERVLCTISGPVLKNYFLVKKGLNEQVRCNIQLLDKLFKNYFYRKGVRVYDISRKTA